VPDPQLLGALYAILAVLALLVLVGIAALLSAWSWLRSHGNGELRWNRYAFAIKAEHDPATISPELAKAREAQG